MTVGHTASTMPSSVYAARRRLLQTTSSSYDVKRSVLQPVPVGL